MPKLTKYVYEYIVQGKYGPRGWEDLTAHETLKAARKSLREYQDNDGYTFAHRVIHRRTLREPSNA